MSHLVGDGLLLDNSFYPPVFTGPTRFFIFFDGGSRNIERRLIAVDADLSKFFDRVNHDLLMTCLGYKVKGKRLLRLIKLYLRAGVMDGRVFVESREGVPQGGPLSPLLANIMLDPLDKELEKRGHKFARYADDFTKESFRK
ncbi:MAG: hypothetical protein KKB30_09955, partial [Proteobacteria bacterium]|nr:hypothetical protein [Pseudomonadota bacterium]